MVRGPSVIGHSEDEGVDRSVAHDCVADHLVPLSPHPIVSSSSSNYFTGYIPVESDRNTSLKPNILLKGIIDT